MVSPERDIQGAASLDDEVLGCPVTPVREALEATYETDAHLYPAVLYVDGEPEAQQPRLKKAGLGAFSAVGDVSITSVFIDVDNEGHNPWASTKEATSTLETLIDAHGDGDFRGLEGWVPSACCSRIHRGPARDGHRYSR